jgi:Tol biopolymer transport system component
MNADGSDQKRLTTSGAQAASWSPDGKTIAFDTSSKASGGSGFGLMSPDGSNQRQILGKGSYSLPRWSPDGSRIAFMWTGTTTPQVLQIYLVNPDGSDLVQLTKDPESAGFPEWSSDSQRISFSIFARADSKFISHAVIDRDGTNRQIAKRAFWGQSCSLWAQGGCGEDLNVGR